MERNQWDEAEPLLAKAVDVCPEAPDARSKYADLLWRQGRRPDAIGEMAEGQKSAGTVNGFWLSQQDGRL